MPKTSPLWTAKDNLPKGAGLGNIAADFVHLFSSQIIKQLFTKPEVSDAVQAEQHVVTPAATPVADVVAQSDTGNYRNRPARRVRALRERQKASVVRGGSDVAGHCDRAA